MGHMKLIAPINAACHSEKRQSSDGQSLGPPALAAGS